METITEESAEQAATRGRGSGRGFTAMTPERRREISSLGGKATHAAGRAHQFTAQEAAAAGRKGWGAAARRRRAARLAGGDAV